MLYSTSKFIFMGARLLYLQIINPLQSFISIVTFNRVARWIKEIQQFDLEIRHITGYIIILPMF
jgi:hypothetical protein